MHFIESGHRTHARRSGKDRGNHHFGDLIEGREIEDPKVEPELTRQKPPRSVRDAPPAAEDADRTKVRCRQSIRARQPQTIPLVRAKELFQSHELKCQSCQHRPQCATA